MSNNIEVVFIKPKPPKLRGQAYVASIMELFILMMLFVQLPNRFSIAGIVVGLLYGYFFSATRYVIRVL